ncbi:MAG: hypothetical protein ACK5HP_03810 [Bacilli bacterium]
MKNKKGFVLLSVIGMLILFSTIGLLLLSANLNLRTRAAKMEELDIIDNNNEIIANTIISKYTNYIYSQSFNSLIELNNLLSSFEGNNYKNITNDYDEISIEIVSTDDFITNKMIQRKISVTSSGRTITKYLTIEDTSQIVESKEKNGVALTSLKTIRIMGNVSIAGDVSTNNVFEYTKGYFKDLFFLTSGYFFNKTSSTSVLSFKNNNSIINSTNGLAVCSGIFSSFDICHSTGLFFSSSSSISNASVNKASVVEEIDFNNLFKKDVFLKTGLTSTYDIDSTTSIALLKAALQIKVNELKISLNNANNLNKTNDVYINGNVSESKIYYSTNNWVYVFGDLNLTSTSKVEANLFVFGDVSIDNGNNTLDISNSKIYSLGDISINESILKSIDITSIYSNGSTILENCESSGQLNLEIKSKNSVVISQVNNILNFKGSIYSGGNGDNIKSSTMTGILLSSNTSLLNIESINENITTEEFTYKIIKN